MLRVAELAHRSDTGRQRQANEDSFFSGDPVFAVADGMGGAQAGELASRLAAESFQPAERGDSPPEAFLRSIAVGANERIHSRAQEDSTASGMDTTLTAALVEGEEISLAHVGDSRAYRFRDGELKLLTSDHSLVEELRRQGRLTDEQAEEHPQRSIITRALGPEVEVEVDTMTYRAKAGDVYLLCSDGLTSMIKDDRIASILAESPNLDEASEALVAAANEAGGRDNITVVAFRLDAEEAVAADGGGPSNEGATLVGPAAEEAGLTAAGVGAARSERPPDGGLSAEERPRRRAASSRDPGAARPPKRRRGRTALKVLLVLAILAGLGVAAVYGVRQVYYLGTGEGGRVALFRGLPYEPLGIDLHSEVDSIPVRVSSLPQARQDAVTENELRSQDDAESLLGDIKASAREPRPEPEPRGGGGNGGGGGDGAAGGGDADGGDAGGGDAGGATGGGAGAGGGTGGDAAPAGGAGG